MTGELPAQMDSNAENVSIRWRHHDTRYDQLCMHCISATVTAVDEVQCFGSSPFPQPQHMFIDEMTDDDLSSCIELVSIATKVVRVYVPINRRPISSIKVHGFGLHCKPITGVSVFTADICQSDLCNIEHCVTLVALHNNQPATSHYLNQCWIYVVLRRVIAVNRCWWWKFCLGMELLPDSQCPWSWDTYLEKLELFENKKPGALAEI